MTKILHKHNITKHLEKAIDLSVSVRLMSLDNKFIEEGGKIIYVIDNNISNLYTEPGNRAISGETADGVANIFPNDTHETMILVTRYLANYIFFELSQEDNPILMLNNAVQGLSGYITSLIESISTKSETINTTITKLLNKREFSSIIDDEATNLEKIKSLKELTIRINSFDEDLLQFKRLSSLIKLKKLYSGDKFVKLISIKDKDVTFKRLLREDFTLKDMMDLSNNKLKWIENIENIEKYRTLEEKSKGKGKKYQIDKKGIKQAEILSKIELINKRIENKYRIVLITTTSNIYKAADFEKINDDNYVTFSDKYIRQPKQFISKLYENTTINHKENSISLESWLDIFLGKVEIYHNKCTLEKLKSKVIKKELADNINDLNESDLNTIVEKIDQEWIDFNDNYSLNNASINLNSQSTLLKYYPEFENEFHLQKSLKKLKSKIQKDTKDAWEEFTQIGIQSGYMTLGNERIVRLPPPVFFKRHSIFSNKIMMLLLGHQPYRPNELKDFFSELAPEEGINNKASEYHLFYLVFSFLFTVANRPEIAKHLVKEAIAFAKEYNKKQTDDKNKIDLREAKFLLAYIFRVMKPDGENNIQNARKYLKISKDKISSDDQFHSKILLARHKAERLSLELSIELNSLIGNDLNLPKLKWKFKKRKRKALKICKTTQKLLKSIEGQPNSDNDNVILNLITASSCCDYYTNLISKYISNIYDINIFNTKKTIKRNKKMFKYFNQTKNNLKHLSKQSSDIFSLYAHTNIMHIFASILNQKNKSIKNSHKVELNSIIEKEFEKKPSDYFKNRFNIIINIIKEL